MLQETPTTSSEYMETHQLQYYFVDAFTLLKQINPENELEFLQN
jgi:hypothetical protein